MALGAICKGALEVMVPISQMEGMTALALKPARAHHWALLWDSLRDGECKECAKPAAALPNLNPEQPCSLVPLSSRGGDVSASFLLLGSAGLLLVAHGGAQRTWGTSDCCSIMW